MAPSSIAMGKSPLMPMDSTSRFSLGYAAAQRSRHCRRLRKQARVTSSATPQGAMVIKPRTCRCVQIGQALEKLRGFGGLRVQSGLGLFRAELDLDQHGQALAEFACGFIQALGEAKRVERIDGVKELDSASSLVRLQMADEMHEDRRVGGSHRSRRREREPGREPWRRIPARGFRQRPAGPAQPPPDDRCRRVGLRDGHQLDIVASAAGAAAGLLRLRLRAFRDSPRFNAGPSVRDSADAGASSVEATALYAHVFMSAAARPKRGMLA